MAEGWRERLCRMPVVGTALTVQHRFSELHGGFVASAVTLAAFLSLFPLVLVAIAVFGFFSAGSAGVPERVIEALGIPPRGTAAETIRGAIDTAERSKGAASILGLAGLLWTGLGLVAAVQYAYNAAWQVTGRGLRDKAVGLVWLAGAAVLFVASFAMTTALGLLPRLLAPLTVVVGLVTGTMLFLWTARLLGNRDIGWRGLLPGAALGAVGFEVLKALGGIYVPRAVASSSALYGSIGVVFAILAWLFLFGRLVVYAAVLDVVLWERGHGTVTMQLEAPRLPGRVPLEATRAGEAGDGSRARVQ